MTKKRIFCAALLAAASVLAYLHRDALMSILTVAGLSVSFAVLLAPLCSSMENRGIRPAAASALSVAVLLLVVLLVISVFVPYLIIHSMSLIRRSAPVLAVLYRQASEIEAGSKSFLLQQSGAGEAVARLVTSATTSLTQAGISIAAMTGKFFFSTVIAYYLLKERKPICRHLLLAVPLRWRKSVLSALQGCRNVMMSYLSGVAKTSLFVAGATYMGLLALGIPDALLLSLLMGILEMLPYVGPVLASIPVILSSLPLGLNQTLLALVLLFLVQQAESNFVSPYFTASSTSIHPLSALISVFVFSSLMGLWGIVIAVPALVLLRSVSWSLRQTVHAMKA